MDAGIDGPAIVTRPDTTTVACPGHHAAVDNAGTLMDVHGGEAS